MIVNNGPQNVTYFNLSITFLERHVTQDVKRIRQEGLCKKTMEK